MFTQSSRRLVAAAATMATLAAIACSSAGPTPASTSAAPSNASATGTAGATAAASPRRDRAVITTQDLAESQVQNLYDAVQHLHPEWLKGRNTSAIGGSASSEVQVYLETQH